SPLMLIPLFATPAYRRKRPVILAIMLTTLAILGPWVAERVHWISPTILFDNHLCIASPAIHSNPVLILIALSIYAPAFLYASAAVTLRRASVEESAQARLHLQAGARRHL